MPAIAFDCDFGPRTILDEGRAGLLVPRDDVDALAGAMARMLDEPELRAGYIANCAAVLQSHSLDAVLREWDDVVDSVSRRSPARRYVKAIHLITNFTGSAGAETMLARIVRNSAAEQQHVVSLMTLSDRNTALAGPRVSCQALGATTLRRMAMSPLAVARLLRQERPQAVMCWMYHAMVVGTLARELAGTRVPLYWNVRQSLDDPRILSRSTRAAVLLSRWLSRLPAGIIFNSRRALELHQREGFANPNCLMIPNGVEMATTAPARGPARRFGVVARLSPQKDHATLFRAIALARRSHPDVSFVLAGTGLLADNPTVRRMVEAAGLEIGSIDLLGEVADMTAFYSSIDALVLSSRTEGFPNVVAEAMAHGRPAITTDVGDAAEIVGDTGIVVPPKQPSALAEAIGRLHDLPSDDFTALAVDAQARARSHYALPPSCGATTCCSSSALPLNAREVGCA